VSVRNALEAQAAVAGGCDLLDIKEPARGPLGMADFEVMASISQFAAGYSVKGRPFPCSAALGELVDWAAQPLTAPLALGIGYVKFGSAELKSPEQWIDAWRLAQSHVEAAPQRRLRWVVVAYADWQSAKSLEPARLLEAVVGVRCDAFLIDTFDKGSGNLLTHIDTRQLRQLGNSAHRAGLTFAVAGGIRRAQLRELVEVGPDIIGVRGAACAGAVRTAPISAKAVRALKRELAALYTSHSDSCVTA
jgi:(5-formylfuran-3-yl)methyl phosphate synthase